MDNLMSIVWMCCGTWPVIMVVMALWFAWLDKRGTLICDAPDDVADIF